MKKLFFTTIPMQVVEPAYSIKKEGIDYSNLIYMPITVTLAENIEKGDEVVIISRKIIDIHQETCKKDVQTNYEHFQNEINEIVKQVGAKVTYKEIISDFEETKDVFGEQFMKLFDVLEKNVKIYTDVTFGDKPFSFILMNLMYFAEKFYNADIKSVVYGKTTIIKDESGKSHPNPQTSKVCDISALYFLNNITANMEADSGEEAKNMLRMFFGM